MSETTKIDKVRVNGVLYDLAGSGSGGVSGLYTAPLDLLEADYTGFQKATIDPMELVQQLQKSGINTNEPPIMDEVEDGVSYSIGNIRVANLNNSNDENNGGSTTKSRNLISVGAVSNTPLIQINIYKSYSSYYDMEVIVCGTSFGGNMTVEANSTPLDSLIINFFNNRSEYYIELPYYDPNQLGYIINSINIYYDTASTNLTYYISNLTEFCNDVFIEYNSGSDSGIVFNNVGGLN